MFLLLALFMPKTIVSRSSTGLENCSRVYRTGHVNKVIRFCCPEMPDPVSDGVAYVQEMNKINEKFFQPYFDNPLDVDPETIYSDLLEFFKGEKERYTNVSPDLIAQINFITNAMTLVRKDASQYFLLNLQNAAMAKQIESTIQGLIMNTYMLNTKISILTGYEGDDGIAGSTKIKIAEFKDPRYIMAQFQPDLTMLSFLYPNEPTAKYYMRLKKLLEMSGLYESKQDVSNDLIKFLDRFLVKHDLTLTLAQWLEAKENEELMTSKKLEEIKVGNEHLEINQTKGKNLDESVKRPRIIPVNNVLEGMMVLQGSISMTTTDISFDLDTLANSSCSDAKNIINKLTKLPSKKRSHSIKDSSRSNTFKSKKRTYHFPKCSTTRKNHKLKNNNKTRKNICE